MRRPNIDREDVCGCLMFALFCLIVLAMSVIPGIIVGYMISS